MEIEVIVNEDPSETERREEYYDEPELMIVEITNTPSKDHLSDLLPFWPIPDVF